MHIQSATPGANDAPICICGGGNLQEEVIRVEVHFPGCRLYRHAKTQL